MKDSELGTATVKRTFNGTRNGKPHRFLMGEKIPREDLLKMPRRNLLALVENRFMVITPPQEPAAGSEIFIMNMGFGNYHVVRGHRLNDKVLKREAAEELAGAHGYVPPTKEGDSARSKRDDQPADGSAGDKAGGGTPAPTAPESGQPGG